MNKLILWLGLMLTAIVGMFIVVGLNHLLTYYLLKRCIKCFHLLEKNGNCKYCERERNYE